MTGKHTSCVLHSFDRPSSFCYLSQLSSCEKRRSAPALSAVSGGLENAETGVVPQDHLMAELKRVGTQQEALKKAVAEGIASAHDSGQSLFVPPLKNFADPSQPEKAADNQPATPEAPGIQARWTGSAPSTQASDAAAQKKVADGGSRAASLAEPISRAQIHQTPAAPLQHGKAAEVPAAPALGPVFEVPLAPPSKVPAAIVQQGQASESCALPMDQEGALEKPDQSAEAIAELKDNPAVKDRRGDLSKMQVALGGRDNTGAAAFEPSQYTFGHVPSQPGKLAHCVHHKV